MNDIATRPDAGLPAQLGYTVKDVITKEELQSMPLGMRIEFVPEVRAHFEGMAREMAESDLTREHLRGKPDACMSVIKNALNWRMDPRAVAGKTYSPGKGTIGIEGVLASAIMLNSGRIEQIEYEHVGDWEKVEGQWANEQLTWPNGKKKTYKSGDPILGNVAKWKPEDEKGLGCIGHATMKTGKVISTPPIMLAECHPRNAQTWPSAPKRQIIHVVERALCNMICGDILMGVHIDAGLTRHFADNQEAPAAPVDITPPKAADPIDDGIKGAGRTEGMQEGGYTDAEEVGDTTSQSTAPKPRKRIKIKFRGKTITRTDFLRDVKQLIGKYEDYDDLVKLGDDVKDSIRDLDSDIKDVIAADLSPRFVAAFAEFEVAEGEQGDTPHDPETGEVTESLDLTGDDE